VLQQLAVAFAFTIAAALAGGMSGGAGFAAIVFSISHDVMAFGDFAFAIRALTLLFGSIVTHGNDN